MSEETQQDRDYAVEIDGSNTITISQITNWGAISRGMLDDLASEVGMKVAAANDTGVQFHGESRLEGEQALRLSQLLSGLARINPEMQITTA